MKKLNITFLVSLFDGVACLNYFVNTMVAFSISFLLLGVFDVAVAAEKEPLFHTILSSVGSSSAKELYPFLNGGKFDGPSIKESPDPIIRYRWKEPKETDALQVYYLKPISTDSVEANSFSGLSTASNEKTTITVTKPGSIRVDFGVVSGSWVEFESSDCPGNVEMVISEYNEPAVGKSGVPVRYGNTYRLELNSELYDGMRFAWINVKETDKPWHITGIRAVCQVKPTNYQGSFSCSDPLLTKSWYVSAYSVKTSLCKDYFGSILMDRGDRMSWTGDAHTSQAAALVAFGNYDFICKNIVNTAEQGNGIRSYSLYWVFSLMDYFLYSGDSKTLDHYINNACAKLDEAYGVFGKNPDLRFYGWDERLCAGFEIWFRSCQEAQYAYQMLSIRAWADFGKVMGLHGRKDLEEKYVGYANDKMAELRSHNTWFLGLGLHAAADAINTGILNRQESDTLSHKCFQDRVNCVSFSPFNQYFIIQAMAKVGKYDEALDSVKDMWGGMVKNGATTTYEVFRPSWNNEIPPNAAVPNGQSGVVSLCHPWGAGVVKWLNEVVLGIVPTLPGFKKYDLLPHPGQSLTQVSGDTPTPFGNISASFDFKSGICKVSAPNGTIGRFGIPKIGKSIASIIINGKLAWDGVYHPVDGIRAASQDAEFVYFNDVQPSTYSISVKYSGNTLSYREPGLVYAAKVVELDVVHAGDWGGVYGKDGYVLCNYEGGGKDRNYLPSYVTSVDYFRAFPKNGPLEPIVWDPETIDRRALAADQKNSLKRRASCYSNSDNTLSVTIHADGKKEYQVALYFVDWEKKGSRLAVEMFDAETLNLIAPVKIVERYSDGAYLVYKYSRSAKFRINKVRGNSVTLSGIFFDSIP